jgi:hypothetical protein
MTSAVTTLPITIIVIVVVITFIISYISLSLSWVTGVWKFS